VRRAQAKLAAWQGRARVCPGEALLPLAAMSRGAVTPAAMSWFAFDFFSHL